MSMVPDHAGDDQPGTHEDHGHDEGDGHDVGRFPPGIAEAPHLLGAYLYRVDQLVLTAPDAEALPSELRRLRELLARPSLRRRVLWDLLIHRFLLTEYDAYDAPKPPDDGPDAGAQRSGNRQDFTLAAMLVALRRFLRVALALLRDAGALRLDVEPVGKPVGASQLLALGQEEQYPDLAPVLVQRVRTITVPRGVPRPALLPHHVVWAGSHPMGYSAAPPVPDSEPLPDLPEPASKEESIVVAVVDNGVDTGLGWFGGTVDQADALPGPLTDGDRLRTFAGHGTFVAGTVLDEARRRREPGGWQVRVLSLVIGDANGYLTDADAAGAVDLVRRRVEQGGPATPSVVVLPWGGYTHDGAGLPLVSAAVRALVALPAAPAVTAAAGNDGMIDRVTYPASLKDVVAVAATTGAAAAADFTNRGWWVDASARGEELLGPFPVVGPVHTTGVHQGDVSTDVHDLSTGWARWSGTSFAVARVAGVLAREIAEAGGGISGVEAWRRVRARSGPLSASLGVLVLSGEPPA
jgi:hypothetical protein